MHGNTESYIVRIWYEETNGEDSVLVQRGSVEHVGSKRRIYFENLEQVLEFIEEHQRA